MLRLLVFLLLLTAINSYAQKPAFNAVKATGKVSPKIPKGIKYRGDLSEAWAWKDSLGDNVLLLSTLPPAEVKDEGNDSGTRIQRP